MPSAQLQTYFQLRAGGAEVAAAALQSGLGAKEAALWEADVERGDEEALALARAGARARAREAEQSKEETKMPQGNVAADQLRLFIERIERLHEERKGIADDIRDVFSEAKSQGFDTTAMKRVIKIRGMEAHTRQEAEAILATYLEAVGLSADHATVALAA